MIKIFNRDDIGFKPPVRRNRKHNVNAYGDWVVKTLKEVHGKELEEGQRWYAPAIRMNKVNNDFVSKHMGSPFDFLDIGPGLNDNLADDEIEILEDEIIEGYNYERQ